MYESASVAVPEMLRIALFPLAEDKSASGSRASSISDSTERAAAIQTAKMMAPLAAAAPKPVPPKSPQDLGKMTSRQMDSMSMLELAKAQQSYDSKAVIKAKRMREEVVAGGAAMTDAKKKK